MTTPRADIQNQPWQLGFPAIAGVHEPLVHVCALLFGIKYPVHVSFFSWSLVVTDPSFHDIFQ